MIDPRTAYRMIDAGKVLTATGTRALARLAATAERTGTLDAFLGTLAALERLTAPTGKGKGQ